MRRSQPNSAARLNMKQATAIGASLMTSRISCIVTSNNPSKPRFRARAFGVSVMRRPMPKKSAKNITDRMALLLPITSMRLFGMMLTKASIPDGCSAPVLTISPARPEES